MRHGLKQVKSGASGALTTGVRLQVDVPKEQMGVFPVQTVGQRTDLPSLDPDGGDRDLTPGSGRVHERRNATRGQSLGLILGHPLIAAVGRFQALPDLDGIDCGLVRPKGP